MNRKKLAATLRKPGFWFLAAVLAAYAVTWVFGAPAVRASLHEHLSEGPGTAMLIQYERVFPVLPPILAARYTLGREDMTRQENLSLVYWYGKGTMLVHTWTLSETIAGAAGDPGAPGVDSGSDATGG